VRRFWICLGLMMALLFACAATVWAQGQHARRSRSSQRGHRTGAQRHKTRKHHKCQKHHRCRKKHKRHHPTGQRAPFVPAPGTTTGVPASSGAAIQHVVWIWMENNDYSNIFGPQPYETQLANTYGLAEDYYGVGHYSADNYIAATSGIPWNSCLGGDGSASSCPQSQDNIFHQLGAGNAVNYVESGNTDSNHNPSEYYTDLSGGNYEQSLPSAPFSSSAFNPKFVFISPNRTDDDHDTSASAGDSWLSSEVPAIMATPQYQSGTMAIFVTFDESNVNDTVGATTPPNNHLYTAVISPYTHGVKSSTPYTHWSLLRTTEELLGLPLLGNAATANSMVANFGL
jgi:hypothetical protein